MGVNTWRMRAILVALDTNIESADKTVMYLWVTGLAVVVAVAVDQFEYVLADSFVCSTVLSLVSVKMMGVSWIDDAS